MVASAGEQGKPQNAPPTGRAIGGKLLGTAIVLFTYRLVTLPPLHIHMGIYGANDGNPVYFQRGFGFFRVLLTGRIHIP